MNILLVALALGVVYAYTSPRCTFIILSYERFSRWPDNTDNLVIKCAKSNAAIMCILYVTNIIAHDLQFSAAHSYP